MNDSKNNRRGLRVESDRTKSDKTLLLKSELKGFRIFATVFALRSLKAKGSKMTGTKKSGLRKIATIATSGVVLVALVATLAINIFAEKPQYPDTAEFLQASFVDGKYIDGFTPGIPDYGFTLEAMAQLKFAGLASSDQQAAVDEVLLGDTSYLYNAETNEPILGLVGKYLFTSEALGVSNQERTEALVAEILPLVGVDGSLEASYVNTFDYAWLILGLYAVDEKDSATLLGNYLATLTLPDGGFGFDQSPETTASSTDATGIATQALALLRGEGDQTGKDTREFTINTALDFLGSTIIDGNHFESYEALDVNGTAYAAMAISAAKGEKDPAIQLWLESQLFEDNGFSTPWTEGKGDVFATAQAYLALEGKSYLDLIGK